MCVANIKSIIAVALMIAQRSSCNQSPLNHYNDPLALRLLVLRRTTLQLHITPAPWQLCTYSLGQSGHCPGERQKTVFCTNIISLRINDRTEATRPTSIMFESIDRRRRGGVYIVQWSICGVLQICDINLEGGAGGQSLDWTKRRTIWQRKQLFDN